MPHRLSIFEEGRGRITKSHLYPAILLLPLLLSCSVSHKISRIVRDGVEPSLSLSSEAPLREVTTPRGAPSGDTLKVTGPDGRELLIMRALRDEESGEMVATEELAAAVVTARFRNVAERRGRIALEFLITVPSELQDKGWQLRFHPRMHVLQDTLWLDDVLITGDEYRKQQIRGYRRYRNYYDSIVRDSMRFVDGRSLGIFLDRNPEEESGIPSDVAIEHYTWHLAKDVNRVRQSRLDLVRKRYIKSPIVTGGTAAAVPSVFISCIMK